MTRIPRQSRSIATVNAIIDAGFICLARHGATGTTTNHIAEAAGLSTGSVYEYFANKEAIYAAMRERFLLDIETIVRDTRAHIADLSVDEVIRSLADDFNALLLRDQRRYAHLIRLILLDDSRDFSERIVKLLTDFVVQYLISHPEYTRVRHLHSAIYVLINGCLYSILNLHGTDRPPMGYDELIDSVTRLVKYFVAQDFLEQGLDAPTR